MLISSNYYFKLEFPVFLFLIFSSLDFGENPSFTVVDEKKGFITIIPLSLDYQILCRWVGIVRDLVQQGIQLKCVKW